MTATSDCWPIFVLTLRGDDARRSQLLEKLGSLELEFRLHFGVDGRLGMPEQFEEFVDRDAARKKHDRDLSDGELACSLSHRAIYQQMLEQGLDGALVLEDDAIVDERLFNFVAQESYRGADLIMLDHSHARVHGPHKVLRDGSVARKLSLPSCLTTAYSISGRACRHLLEASTPVMDLADWPGDICSLGALVLDPPIVARPDPIAGTSHLREARAELTNGHSSPARLFQAAFWRRWITKRLSRRIS